MHSLEGADRQLDQRAEMSWTPRGYEQPVPRVKYTPCETVSVHSSWARGLLWVSEPQREESQRAFEVSQDAKTTLTFV